MYKNISSPQNPLFKKIIKLKKSKERKQENLILIEGLREIIIALKAGVNIKNLIFDTEIKEINEKLKKSIDKNNFINIDHNLFEKISLRENPDGYLAIAEPKKNDLHSYKVKKDPLILILEDLEKPGNFGAIFRTADVFGVDAILICEPRTDIYNPNIIRASLGTVFTNQIFICSKNGALDWLKKNKIAVMATTPHSDNNFYKINYKKGVAIAIGSEDKGLSKEFMETADKKILIPMNGKINSLNASVSAAIVLTEANRQRNLI